MVKLHTIGKIKIMVFGRDHRPPHFHVETPDTDAIVVIETLVVLRGTLPAGQRKAILAWATTHRALLVEAWNRSNPGLTL